MIYAKVVADSVTGKGQRLTTMEVGMHRFVLAEFNTHRAFSRNSASSRAIPVKKQTEKIVMSPAMPVEWGVNKSGMQADEVLDEQTARRAERIWKQAALNAVESARQLEELGVHKQVTNRILEPFMWHKVIVSSTEWQNFFDQRCSPLAQPEMRLVAEAMRDAYNNSVPNLIFTGEFHLPYLEKSEEHYDHSLKIYTSVARCARVSYLNHNNKKSTLDDFGLYQKLVSADPQHLSPLEHIATPIRDGLDVSGNFDGYAQLRHNQHLEMLYA